MGELVKRYFIALLMLLLTCAVQAQDHRVIDSLNQQYAAAKQDTDKINILFELGDALLGSNPDSCLVVNYEVREIAEKGLESSLSTSQ